MKRICLATEAARSLKLPRKLLVQAMEEFNGGEAASSIQPIASLARKSRRLMASIRNKEVPADEVPALRSIIESLGLLADHMKQQTFTHFINDASHSICQLGKPTA